MNSICAFKKDVNYYKKLRVNKLSFKQRKPNNKMIA